jgi:hypothetical protein
VREVGDELFVVWNNQYFGQKCKITKVNKMKGRTSFDIELLEKQDSWLRAEEGKRVTLNFSNVHYCDLKENI